MNKNNYKTKLGFLSLIIIFVTIIPIAGMNLMMATSSVPCDQEGKLDTAGTMTLYDASINVTHVEVWINGTFDFFYAQCINVTIKQLTAEAITVIIAAGTKLIPGDSGTQTMVVANTTVLSTSVLDEMNSTLLWGFCCESDDAGPGDSDTFTVSPTPYGPTSCVGKIMIFFDTVNATFIGTMIGQLAVWACIDGPASVTTMAEIVGWTDEVNAILLQAGTGIQLGEDGIPGFEILPILLVVFLIVILTRIAHKRSNNKYLDII
ncbi:MAG: hypothetical protein HWN65_22220 [Candidatus Helarchaeota archaeon]|nr:hypothetical protein [Candidatus Helarchaeota archaeon]